jgi:Cytochrome P460
VKAPHGLALSEFKGYETWQVIGVSQSPNRNLIEVILGNPAMIAAYKGGLPGNGQPFPNGARMAKIHWNAKTSKDPGQATVPDTLHDVDFMVKDTTRFPDANGWGFQQFAYDRTSNTFTPTADDAKCGVACHTVAKDRDYVFTAFPKR